MRDATSAEDAVDRRLVSSLVVNFCAAPRSGAEKTRYEILQVMDGILKFSDDEKWKIGLANRPKDSSSGSSPVSASAASTLGQNEVSRNLVSVSSNTSFRY